MRESIWVCLACGKHAQDRYEFRDVSCAINAKVFNLDDVVFSRDDPDRIVRVDVAYIFREHDKMRYRHYYSPAEDGGALIRPVRLSSSIYAVDNATASKARALIRRTAEDADLLIDILGLSQNDQQAIT